MSTATTTRATAAVGGAHPPPAVILLWVEDAGSGGRYLRYQGNSGKEYLFERDGSRRHALRIPIDKWRANKYWIARDLLAQQLVTPIFFDVERLSVDAEEPQEEPWQTPERVPTPAPSIAEIPKRGRGRPRKYPPPAQIQEVTTHGTDGAVPGA